MAFYKNNKDGTRSRISSNQTFQDTPTETLVTRAELNSLIKETNEHDGVLVADEADNIGVHIGDNECWESASYSDKYGFGGYPYGYENLPPKNRFAGIVESDMFSVDGGKGRWNGKDTGNCQNGGHLFEGWNTSHDSRLTMGIGLKDKDVAFVQVFHPTSAEGANDNYYGILKLGDDRLGTGTVFSESLMKNQGLICLSTSYTNAVKNTVDKMANAGELSDTDFDATDKIPYGATSQDQSYKLHVLIYGSDKSYLDGEVIADNIDMSNYYTLSNYDRDGITIFGGWYGYNNGSFMMSSVRIQYVKLYNGNTLVHDLRAYLKNGIPCMKDEVTGEYYYNQGDGEFGFGEVIE